MIKKFFQSNRRTVTFIGVLLVIFAAIVVFSLATGETGSSGNHQAFTMSDKELKVISCSLDGLSGVSQGAGLEIRYNQLISIEAARDIAISPSIKGEWQAVDSRLIFTPANRWEAGTYYTVTINNNNPLSDMQKTLSAPASFSFETQDSALRIPAKASFSTDKRQYFFRPDEDIVLEAGYNDANGNINAAVSVKVWQFSGTAQFVDTFTPLFSLPSWAQISKSKFTGDTDGLKFLGKSDIPLVDGKIEYPSLPPGQYLFRLVIGGAACDVAVTIDDISLYTIFNGNDLYLWGHQGDTPLVGAKVRIGEEVTAFDRQGCAKIAYNPSQNTAEPESVAVQINDNDISHVVFLEEDDLIQPSYSGEILTDKTIVNKGDNLAYTGTLSKSYNMTEEAQSVTVVLSGESGNIISNRIDLENGIFNGVLKDLQLPEGNYCLTAMVKGQTVAITEFSMASESDKNASSLIVTGDSTTIEPGESLAFKVKAVLSNGTPIVGLNIRSSQGAAQGVTDKNGETTVYITGENSFNLPVIKKLITFSATLGKEELTASASYNVVSETPALPEAQEESTDTQGPTDPGESDLALSLTIENEDFIMTQGISDNADLIVTMKNGQYTTELPGGPLSLTTAESYTLDSGDTLAVSVNPEGGYRNRLAAKLYPGDITQVAAGKTYYNESPVLAEDKAVAGYTNDSGYFTFSTQGLYGSYYLEITAVDQWGNKIYRYIPVEINNGGSLITAVEPYYSAGQEITLNLTAMGKDLSYTIILDEEQVAAGDIEEHTTVSLGTREPGPHRGKITLYSGSVPITSQAIEFKVYTPEPGFMAISDEPTDASAEMYAVPADQKDYYKKLFAFNLFPGNQLLQVMGRSEFYQALGENAGILSTYIDNDFGAFQNADGSFSRLPGTKGDLLLSALVAGDKDAQYDQGALKSFFRFKMNTDTDTERLALCYWGLSLLDSPPMENMVYHVKDKSFTDRAKLYLAQAFIAAGDRENATYLYNALAKDLKTTDKGTYFPKEDDTESISKALFMLDLAIKLDKNEADGLLNYLMSAEMTTQTSRYMLCRCLLQYISNPKVELTQGDIDSEQALLSIEPWLPATEKAVKGDFFQNSARTESVQVGDIFSLELDWQAYQVENSLYMLYFTNSSMSFLPENNLVSDHGHIIYLTMDTKAELYLRGDTVQASLGEGYIFDLTTGKIIAQVDFDELVVSE